MKRRITMTLVAAVACVLVLWTATDAQVNYPKGTPINPYTGQPLAAPVANPLTGAPPASGQPNALTGMPGQPPASRNQYTGRPVPANQGFNPLTAKLQHGLPPAGQTMAGTPQWPAEEIPIS